MSQRHHMRNLGGRASLASDGEDVDMLVDGAVEAALAGTVREDRTLGAYAPLLGFCHAALMQEGRLIEDSIAHAARRHPDLKLVPSKPMPIVPAAEEMLRRTPPEHIGGVRFPVRVHASESYRPDLFIVNRARHSALLVDVKRSLNAHRPQDIDRLRFRMLAVAAIAPEWLADNQGPLIVKVETAIVDAADQASDPERGVFRLSEIDNLLMTEGTAGFVTAVREAFARRVQEELGRRCRTLTGAGIGAETRAGHHETDHESLNVAQAAELPLQQVGTATGAAPMTTPAHQFGFARRLGVH